MKARTLLFHGLVVVLAIALDQWIKYLVETGLEFHRPVEVLPFLALFRTYNTGVAFSMFSTMGDLGLIVVTLLVVVFILFLAWRTEPQQRWARLGYALVLGGAFGNLIDRLLLGHVVDYVLFHTPVWSFAVFNLADAFITVGAALVILEEFLGWRRSPKEPSA